MEVRVEPVRAVGHLHAANRSHKPVFLAHSLPRLARLELPPRKGYRASNFGKVVAKAVCDCCRKEIRGIPPVPFNDVPNLGGAPRPN